jgi:hypothetical protein
MSRAVKFRTLAAASLLAVAFVMPVQDAAAQEPLIGGILGGAAGAIIGGAAGGRRGAAVGAIIGGATGAIIGAEAQRRRGNYYYWRNGCYVRHPAGWMAVDPGYCGPPVVYQPAPPPAYYGGAPPDAIAYCARRYRSYDPVSQTFLGNDGYRHPCP